MKKYQFFLANSPSSIKVIETFSGVLALMRMKNEAEIIIGWPLFEGTVPTYKTLFQVTAPTYETLFEGIVPTYKALFKDTVLYQIAKEWDSVRNEYQSQSQNLRKKTSTIENGCCAIKHN